MPAITVQKVEKKQLKTGLGKGYVQMVKTEVNGVLTYENTTYEFASLDKAQIKPNYKSSPVWLSNVKHSDMGGVSEVEIQVDAGYFPPGFLEEALGYKKIGESYMVPKFLEKKYFRAAFPLTFDDGSEIIYNFPYCQVEPLEISGETQTADKKEQIEKYNIKAYTVPAENKDEQTAMLYVDLRIATDVDRNKALQQGWYNQATYELIKKSAGTGATTTGRSA